ncbi:hypothetical protein LX77_00690 [Gelidibacter algens]|uniref:Uncharacterized protein n=1 Tax=Gelidibacter algens TaxID=49280 RepID=A0A327SBX7_9FLAO|nr:hypothetical protein [Gelidibacter algens]RAJ26441.1 hypothetical protein LX77_00690 [Gelidibacter algens]
MKTFLTTLLLLGFAQATYSQMDIASAENTNMAFITTKDNSNSSVSTFPKISDDGLPMAERSEKLQLQVFNYDIKSAKVFSPKANTTYSVRFSQGNYRIDAIYAKDGQFIQSEGVFENVPIPFHIGYELAKKYPGWEFHKSWCYSNYSFDKSPKTSYSIEIKKGDKTKVISSNALN